MSQRAWIWAVALAVALATTPAMAQPTDLGALDQQAQERLLTLLDEANRAFDQGRFEAALALYDQALTIARLAEVQFRRAACLERLDRPAEAISAYQDYLSLAPEAQDRGRVEQEIERLLALIHAREQGTLVLITHPAGAEIRIDDAQGRLLGTSPLEATLPPGDHLLHIKHPDHAARSAQVKVAPGGNATLEITLTTPTAPTAPISVHDTDWTTAGAITLGVGGLLVLTSGLLAAMTESSIDEANRYDRRDPDHTRAELNDLQAPINGLATATWVTGAAGVGVLVAGALMIAFDEPLPQGVEASLELSPDHAGVLLTLPMGW